MCEQSSKEWRRTENEGGVMGHGRRPAVVCPSQWQGFGCRDLVGVKDTVHNQQASRTLSPGGRPEGCSYRAQRGGEHRAWGPGWGARPHLSACVPVHPGPGAGSSGKDGGPARCGTSRTSVSRKERLAWENEQAHTWLQSVTPAVSIACPRGLHSPSKDRAEWQRWGACPLRSGKAVEASPANHT